MTTVEFGRVGFDFGLAHEYVTYTALGGTNTIHKVQIPVHLRVTPLKSKYVNLYIKGGASVHGVLYADYQEPLSQKAQDTAPKPYLEDYNDGLLDDGVASNNMYWSLNAGFGIEARIYRNLSTFAEIINLKRQRWQQNGYGGQKIQGGMLGYSKDKLNTIAFNLGVNYSF